MTESRDPRDLEQADETAAAADEAGRTVHDGATVAGDAREEEQDAVESDGPGSLGGDNGGA